MLRTLCAAVALLVAGCSGDAPAEPGTATPANPEPGPAPIPPTATAVPETVSLEWEDDLIVGVWACDATVTDGCYWQPEGAFGKSHTFGGLAGNVSTGWLRLEWTAATPLTAELVLEAAILTPGCGECNQTRLQPTAGVSPLALDLGGLTIQAEEALYVAVYSNQYTASGQGAAGTSGDQPFRVTGSLDLRA